MGRVTPIGDLIKSLSAEVTDGDVSGIAVSFRHDGSVAMSVHQDDPQLVLRLLDACGLTVDDAGEPVVLSCGAQVIGFARHAPGSLRTAVALDWYVDRDGVDALAELADFAWLIRRDALVGV